MAWKKEFEMGIAAHDIGKPHTANPFNRREKPQQYHDWDDGWHFAYDTAHGDPMGDHHGRNE